MQVFEQAHILREQVLNWKSTGHTVGFVPTMGNLHDGHLSLVKLAQQTCDKVVVSVFVNPMQFGPNEDFESYPRTFEDDQLKLSRTQVEAIFYPSVEAVYPNGLEQTRVQVPSALTGLLEGKNRPGHFDGVTTVVAKLLNIVQPNKAFFGQKDYQQLSVIRKMVNDLVMPVEIVSGPIIRDIDGLALSSRNQYLNKKQRAIAPKLLPVLQDVELAICSGNYNYNDLALNAINTLLREGFDAVDYVSICDANTLLPIEDGSLTKPLVILAVARLGNTRLLDNVVIF